MGKGPTKKWLNWKEVTFNHLERFTHVSTMSLPARVDIGSLQASLLGSCLAHGRLHKAVLICLNVSELAWMLLLSKPLCLVPCGSAGGLRAADQTFGTMTVHTLLGARSCKRICRRQ